jgi:hypothetical protein
MRPCLGCGTPSPASRCPACQAAWERQRGTPERRGYDRRYRRLRAQVIAGHVAEHGWTCPGHGRGPHPARDLTAHHRRWPALLPDDLAVLCNACNASAGPLRSGDEVHASRSMPQGGPWMA